LGKLGPLNKNCLNLANMHQIAVDFGKHGYSIKIEKFNDLNKILRKL